MTLGHGSGPLIEPRPDRISAVDTMTIAHNNQHPVSDLNKNRQIQQDSRLVSVTSIHFHQQISLCSAAIGNDRGASFGHNLLWMTIAPIDNDHQPFHAHNQAIESNCKPLQPME